MRMYNKKRRDTGSRNPTSERDGENSRILAARVARTFENTEKMLFLLGEVGSWIHKQDY